MICTRRGCKMQTENDLLKVCSAPDCLKCIHVPCFEMYLGQRHLFKLLPGEVVCTMACYNRLVLVTKLTWTNDGKDGKDDPNTSEAILLQWMLTEGNYGMKWRGKRNRGVTKKQLADNIARLINYKGVQLKRNGAQIQSKIEHMEKQF